MTDTDEAQRRRHQDAEAAPAGWYIVRTAPHFVVGLMGQCRELGAEIYAPMLRKCARRPRTRGEHVVEVPAFPGYAFVRQPDLPALRGLPHRRFQVLRMGDGFVSLAHAHIEQLRRWEAEWNALGRLAKPVERFAVGDIVRVRGDHYAAWGAMEVVGRIGSTLELRGRQCTLRADPAILELLAE